MYSLIFYYTYISNEIFFKFFLLYKKWFLLNIFIMKYWWVEELIKYLSLAIKYFPIQALNSSRNGNIIKLNIVPNMYLFYPVVYLVQFYFGGEYTYTIPQISYTIPYNFKYNVAILLICSRYYMYNILYYDL